MKKKGNWDDKRPGTGERLASRFSLHSVWNDSLGGSPELTTSDFAAAVGAIPDNLQRITLGAKYGNWGQDRATLREIVARRSWAAWQEHKHDGSLNAALNNRITELVLAGWYLPAEHRKAAGDTARAKALSVDYRRYKAEIKQHHLRLISWLDAIEAEALTNVRKKLRK